MAAAELTKTPVIASAASHAARVSDLRRAWLGAYGAIWVATLTSAVIVALSGASVRALVRHWLGLHLDPGGNPAPSVARVFALVAHNVPIAAWPLLLGVLGAHRHRLAQRLADILVVACMIVNVVPAGAALGAAGSALLPYIPQLPFEWAGLALGASAWLVQRKRALTVAEGLAVLAMTTGVLLVAGVFESVVAPHR